ncbi:hypothetical protein CUJ83_15110 [Methanocella sp. CWC-04]|uniref:Uncharacterized protein n=2 Tax=Methanooceanicella nereidis TaxID=2052831 RepID=A0AAP2RGF1_9EURY|nr:hypothetical protein [Methanocella sp. CWC-04]
MGSRLRPAIMAGILGSVIAIALLYLTVQMIHPDLADQSGQSFDVIYEGLLWFVLWIVISFLIVGAIGSLSVHLSHMKGVNLIDVILASGCAGTIKMTVETLLLSAIGLFFVYGGSANRFLYGLEMNSFWVIVYLFYLILHPLVSILGGLEYYTLKPYLKKFFPKL